MEETKFFPELPRSLLAIKNNYIDSERKYNLHPQVPVTHQDPNMTGTLRTWLCEYFLAQTEFSLLSKYLHYKWEVGRRKRKNHNSIKVWAAQRLWKTMQTTKMALPGMMKINEVALHKITFCCLNNMRMKTPRSLLESINKQKTCSCWCWVQHLSGYTSFSKDFLLRSVGR